MRARALGLPVPVSALLGLLVAVSVATCTIVFSEPALTDVLMAGVIAGMFVLGSGRYGWNAQFNFIAWGVLVALGFLGTTISVTMSTAVTHQAVTLFLAVGAFVLAAYVAEDPGPRFRLVMVAYVVASLLASILGIIGYFDLLPGAHDLFTIHDRARGAFKDPNVLGAALGPAIIYLAWVMLRARPLHAALAVAAMLPIMLGLLLSFSRGAWASLAVSLILFLWFIAISSRRRRDWVRLLTVGSIAVVATIITLGVVSQIDTVQALMEQRASLDQSYDQGPEGRFGGQRKALNLILENPFGIGTHSFRDSYHAEETHNVYLSQFLNAGWLGGVLYIASVISTLAAGLRGCLRLGRLQGPLIVATAAFVGLVFEGFVIDTDHWRHFFIIMAMIWGLADAGPVPTPAHRPIQNRH